MLIGLPIIWKTLSPNLILFFDDIPDRYLIRILLVAKDSNLSALNLSLDDKGHIAALVENKFDHEIEVPNADAVDVGV